MSTKISIKTLNLKLVKENSQEYKIDSEKLKSPEIGYDIAKQFLGGTLDREAMLLITLDTKKRPTGISLVSLGSIDMSIVHPREVFKTAILNNAHSIMLIHNHPSGDTNPSKNDVMVTQRIQDAGTILGITLVDHLIIGDKKEDTYSFLKGGIIGEL